MFTLLKPSQRASSVEAAAAPLTAIVLPAPGSSTRRGSKAEASSVALAAPAMLAFMKASSESTRSSAKPLPLQTQAPAPGDQVPVTTPAPTFQASSRPSVVKSCTRRSPGLGAIAMARLPSSVYAGPCLSPGSTRWQRPACRKHRPQRLLRPGRQTRQRGQPPLLFAEYQLAQQFLPLEQN